MLQPVLLVGVGGSGAKSLRTLRQTLMRRLRQAGWTAPGLPSAWQLVAFDTVTDQSRDGYSAPLLPASCYSGLVDPATEYSAVRDILVGSVPAASRMQAYSGWLPRDIPFQIVYGAGQNRGVGRAVSAWKLSTIHGRLSEAYRAAKDPVAIRQLTEAADRLGATGVSSTPIAVVISSIAGGTGSGMFLDVVEGLKAVDATLGQRAQVVLFGPDVFTPVIRAGMGENIPANTMSALAEITAGSWGGVLSAGTRALYQQSGMGSVAAHRDSADPLIGSRYNYIIGSVNAAGVKIGETDDAYRAVGDSLAALVADEKVLDGFNNFFRTNVFDNSWQSNICDDRSGLRTNDDARFTSPFASFGSARLSLGLDRFVEYAAQSVSRSAVERLLWPRFDEDPNDDRTDQEKVEDRAAVRWTEFLDASGLDERADHDQVIERLTPSDHDTAVAAFVNGIVDHAAGGVGPDGQAPADWLARIRAELPNRLERFRRERRSAIEEQASSFARTLESDLLGTVSRFAAREGLWVAEVLVRKLAEEVRFVAQEDLPTEASRFESRLDELDGRLAGNLGVGLKVVPAQHPAIDAARTTLRSAASSLVEASIRRRIAADLLALVASEVLLPLARALSDGRAELSLNAENERTPKNDPNPFLEYPRLGQVPGKRFTPGPTEFLLLPIEEYREVLEELLRRTYPEDLRDQWEQRTIERAILDLPLGLVEEDELPGLLRVTSGWMPTDPALRWRADASPQVGSYEIPVSPGEYRDVAEERLSDPDTSVGRYLGQSLEAYLSIEDPTEQSRRWAAFTNGLVSAFDASAPLANLNQNLLNHLHPNAKNDTFKVLSTIPVDPSSDLFSQIENRLRERGHWNDTFSRGWFGRTTSSQVDIFQALGVGVSAMAFSSLMRPVTQKWDAVRFTDSAEGFRAYKRARPLTETIPVSYDRIEQFVAGWVVSGLLGLRRDGLMTAGMTRAADGAGGGSKDTFRHVEAWDVSDGRWTAFPFPMLERRAQGMQILPATLDAIQVAMAQCDAAGNLEPLAAYRAMMEMGSFLEGEDSLLGAWILHGRAPAGSGEVPATSGTADMTVEERRQRVVDQLTRTLEHYRKHFAEIERASDPFARDLAWEIRDWIVSAYEDVLAAVRSLESTSGLNY